MEEKLYKLGKYTLDKQQTGVIYDESKHLLVVAGAGSGKTLTILGKIDYLINKKNIPKEDILCISFTREASISLKNKLLNDLNVDIDVYTFHKLGLEILKHYESFDIAESDTLENIIRVFFKEDVLNNKNNLKIALNYFDLNKKEYIRFINDEKNIAHVEKLFSIFIHLFKANNFKLNAFTEFLKKSKNIFNIRNYFNEKWFLILALNIYIKYQNYLSENEEIDFDDMLIKSTNYILKNGFKKEIKYIIIDEFQDTSMVRFNLIRAILDSTNASLMAVGDDFQSIYRFTGCDLDIFVNFKSYFKESRILKIETTYRNSQELISVSGNFVMNNPHQIKKNLRSFKHIKKPIKIMYYDNPKVAFVKLIDYFVKMGYYKILIIGRNNNDIYKYIDDSFKYNDKRLTYSKNINLEINYLTAHSSKGLEEDNAIIINLEDSLTGFPNKIKNNKVLRFVTNDSSKFPYDEERRLFYVALTRTKNNVFLLVPKKYPSIFVRELINKNKNIIEIMSK